MSSSHWVYCLLISFEIVQNILEMLKHFLLTFNECLSQINQPSSIIYQRISMYLFLINKLSNSHIYILFFLSLHSPIKILINFLNQFLKYLLFSNIILSSLHLLPLLTTNSHRIGIKYFVKIDQHSWIYIDIHLLWLVCYWFSKEY